MSLRDTTPRKRRPKNCQQCGEEFLPSGEFGNYHRKFCSRECAGAFFHEKATEKYPPREEIVRLYVDEGMSDRALGQHFGHSYQWSLSVRRRYGIPGHAKGESSKKPLHKKRDRERWGIQRKPEECCRNCGRSDLTLHLHHAIPRSMSKVAKYDLRNGVPLCTSCHLGWHHRRVTLYRDIFTAEEWEYISSVRLVGQNLAAWLDDRYPKRPSVDEREAA